MPKKYVVHGAELKCSLGVAPSNLIVLPDRIEILTGKRKANVTDCTPQHIPPFKACKITSPPKPCTPTCIRWLAGKFDHMIQGDDALLDTSLVICMAGGGIIEVTDCGQGGPKDGDDFVITFRKGDTIPDEILSTKPKYSPDPDKWLNIKDGTISINSKGDWIYTNKSDISVRYVDGYPDFSPYYHPTVKPVKIKVSNPTDRPQDYRLANEAAGLNKNSKPPVPTLKEPPEGYIWHHLEDGETMALVEEDIHIEFRHAGGVSVVKKNNQK